MADHEEKIPCENNLDTIQNSHGNPFYDSYTTFATSIDNDILSQALALTHDSPPPDCSHPKLPRPIAIPQIVPGIGKPFARIYAPALSEYHINSQDFMEFIDTLNVVATESPPLQITDLVGDALDTISYHWAQLAGSDVHVPANLGTVAVTKSRTDAYMQNANAELFAPRGLKASISTMEAVAAVLQLPLDTLSLVAVSDENTYASVLEKRMGAVRPYVMEMTLDVTPPAPQTATLAKMSAAQVEKQISRNENRARKEGDKLSAKNDKREDKALKKAEKIEREMKKLDFEIEKSHGELGDLKSKEPNEKADKIERKRDKERRKLEEAKGKLIEYTRANMSEGVCDERREDRRTIEDSKTKDKKERREMKRTKRILWILIENL